MSEPDDEQTDRNLAEEYAERYGGPDHSFFSRSEDSDADPETPSLVDAAEADPELVTLFWRLVLVFNVAVAALAIGPMLIFFRGQWELGLQVTGIGVLTFAYGLFRYYRFRDSRDSEDNG